LRLLAVLALFS